ncbi:MAG: fimbrial protein [Plesiomonas shigelloides]
MKFNNASKIGTLAALMSVCAMANAATSTVTGNQISFSGSVVSSPCGIADGSSTQSVNFGTLSSGSLASGGTSAAQNFNIQLVNCDITSLKAGETPGKGTVTVSFNGGTVASNPNMLATQGGTGVGIKMTGPSGAAVPMNGTAGPVIALVDGSNTLAFSAVAAAANGTSVTPGAFSAVANFSLAYE